MTYKVHNYILKEFIREIL